MGVANGSSGQRRPPILERIGSDPFEWEFRLQGAEGEVQTLIGPEGPRQIRRVRRMDVPEYQQTEARQDRRSGRRGRVDFPFDIDDNPLEAKVEAGDLTPEPSDGPHLD